MKFGKYLELSAVPEWKDHYLNYHRLKDMIKALSQVESKEADIEEGSSGFGERVTSLSMVPNPKPAGKFEGKDITEADFFNFLEAELKKIDEFTEGYVQEVKKKADTLEQEVEALLNDKSATEEKKKELKEELTKRAQVIGDEFLKIEKFANLNFLATHKILKKHDKNLPIPCRRFYITRLHDQRWAKHDYSKIFVQLSKIHSTLRGDVSAAKRDDAGQEFIRTTTKYWVRTENISKVKHIILQHLPVFQHNLDELNGDSQLTNSVYFDNEQLELYHARLDKSPGAIAIRLRWYATQEPKTVFVERKTHRDSWTGEASVKERFIIKEEQVMPFLQGKYTAEDKIAELRKKGTSEEEINYVRNLFNEIYQQIDSKQLRPTMRTQYMRVAYQIPFDATVRISLDTNLSMMSENPKIGQDCITAGRWYRDPKIVVPNTEITRFPHAVLEVKLSLKEGEATPQWVKDLIESGLCTQVHKFSKYLHGCATLLYDQVQALPYWCDDASIRPSMLRSQLTAIKEENKKKKSKKQSGAGVGEDSDDEEEHGHSHANGSGHHAHDSRSEEAYLLAASEKRFRNGPKTIQLMERKPSLGASPTYGTAPEQENHPQDTYSDQDRAYAYFAAMNAPWYKRWYYSLTGYVPIANESELKPRKVPMKVEPKVFFANERTFITYLQMSVTIGAIAAGLLGAASSSNTPVTGGKVTVVASENTAGGARVVGMMLLPIAILFCIYATITFLWRARQIRNKVDSGFHDVVGPTILGILFIVALTAVFLVHLF